MLTRAGFELAPSGYRSAALPVELSSPQGLEVSFHPTLVHEIFSRQLNAIHERMYSVSILFQNHPQRYTKVNVVLKKIVVVVTDVLMGSAAVILRAKNVRQAWIFASH